MNAADEYTLAFRRFCETAPGSQAQRDALEAMRQLRPTPQANDNADLVNESVMHAREHTC